MSQVKVYAARKQREPFAVSAANAFAAFNRNGRYKDGFSFDAERAKRIQVMKDRFGE